MFALCLSKVVKGHENSIIMNSDIEEVTIHGYGIIQSYNHFQPEHWDSGNSWLCTSVAVPLTRALL